MLLVEAFETLQQSDNKVNEESVNLLTTELSPWKSFNLHGGRHATMGIHFTVGIYVLTATKGKGNTQNPTSRR